MGSVRNRVVKRKKKKTARGNRPKGGVEARVVGLDLGKFSLDVLNNRHARGLTQRQLAAKVGATSTMIVFIENSKCMPKADSFAKLCQYFRFKPSDYIPVEKD